MSKFYNILDLELDDWTDPSLPRMYTLPLSDFPFQLHDEFTDESPEFLTTALFPPFTPVMRDNDRLSLEPQNAPDRYLNQPATKTFACSLHLTNQNCTCCIR